VPAARDEAAEGAVARGLRIDVEGLRVVPPRELDDLVLRHVDRPQLRHVADVEVLPVTHEARRYR
jgi:hypothetical protein